MKTFYITLSLIFTCSISYSQVGINTTSPNAALDIQSSNQATPANTDGILIPKVDAFPLTAPGALQHGMVVYLTTTDIPSGSTLGFYYWNYDTVTPVNSLWVPFGGYHRIDDLIDGKSDFDGSENGSSVFLGIDAGTTDDSSDNRNVGVGYQSLTANTTGNTNNAFGYQALYSNTTGSGNIANGTNALFSNTTGSNNTASGMQSLYSNTIGSGNTANGINALFSNSEGNNNTANGINALYLNTMGSNNTANGLQALKSNTTGSGNTANGTNALFSNTEGDFNTASGLQALYSNTTGIRNSANGLQALRSNTSGGSNTASGDNSLQANATGSNNVAIGKDAFYTNSAGSDNVAIGKNAGYFVLGSGNIMIGNQAGENETGSNKLYIANTFDDSDNALIYGEFDNDLVRINGKTETESLQVGDNSNTIITEVIKVTVSDVLFTVPVRTSSLFRDFAVAGASVGATVHLSPQLDFPDGVMIIYARVKSEGIVEVKFWNHYNSTKNVPAMDWYITVIE